MQPHFGLYINGDLVFLQEDTGRCLTPGLEQLPSPYKITRSDRRRCPHRLEIAPGRKYRLRGLLKALAPIPDGGAYWVPETAIDAISRGHLMAAPTLPIVFAAWNTSVRDLEPQLSLTNLAPLVITGVRPQDAKAIANLLDHPRIRTVVICGGYQPRKATAIDWTLPRVADWRAVGSAILHKYVHDIVRKARQ